MATTLTRDPVTPTIVLPPDVEEAVATLFDNYNKFPFITSLFRDYNVVPRGTKAELRENVLQSLAGSDGPLPLTDQALDDYLAGLQRTGAQHVAFFRLPGQGRDKQRLLADLRDDSNVRRLLDLAGWGQLFNSGQYVSWPADLDELPPRAIPDPTLTAVRFKPGQSLLFKWVQWRAWYEYMGAKLAGGQIDRIYERRWEKSFNYVHFNLRNGDSEVMIQRLRTNPERTAGAEIANYLLLMKSLLHADPFDRVPMEPAIRHLLSTKIREVSRWVVLLGKGARMDCSAGRSTFKSVRIPLPFSGRLLHYNWRLHKESRRRIRLLLDARSRLLTIVHPCLEEEHEGILTDARQAAGAPQKPPKLEGVKDVDLSVSF